VSNKQKHKNKLVTEELTRTDTTWWIQALRLKQAVYYSDKWRKKKTEEPGLKICTWKSVSLSQNELVSSEQNITAAARKYKNPAHRKLSQSAQGP